MRDVAAVEIKIWGQRVGALAPLRGRPGFYEFEYAPAFVKTGLELSPFHLPLVAKRRFSFATLNPDTYFGLPGLCADALPDKFGNALIDAYLAQHGIAAHDVTSLQRLLYVGRRAMGALEFEPAQDVAAPSVALPLAIQSLVEDARKALRGEFSTVAQSLIDVGSSAGGARAKAVIGWNPTSHEIVSGQFSLPVGFEYWLLKFDGVGDDNQLGASRGFGRIEYAHSLMAREAGIEMAPCRLLEESGRAHFMTQRFDRTLAGKLHMQTLCGLQHLDFNMPYVHGYEQLMRTVLALNLGADAMEQVWRRCVFNVFIRNCDDHTKNVSFLMDREGQWRLAPAYDVCFAHNPGQGRWTRQHQMLVAGKAQGITRDDLLTLASDFSVRSAKAKFEEMRSVVKRWPSFAEQALVPSREIEMIAGYQEY